MYVRWQQYKSKALNDWQRERNDRSSRLKAILVESTRIDGKPRQKHVAFLGSIEIASPDGGDDRYREFTARLNNSRRLGFWSRALRKLDALHNRISDKERKELIAAIAKTAGQPPTAAELAQLEAERAEILSGDWAKKINEALAGKTHTPSCSFCGVSSADTPDMITGIGSAAICNTCVARCAATIQGNVAKRAKAAGIATTT